MIVLESTAGVVSALPGVAASRTLRLGQLPKLLPIIIQVAVPGPAWGLRTTDSERPSAGATNPTDGLFHY